MFEIFIFLSLGIEFLKPEECKAEMDIVIDGDNIPTSSDDYNGFAYACKDVLTTVKLKGASLKIIGERAFKHCNKLKTIDFSGCPNLEKIEYHVFGYCGFTTFAMPDSVKYLYNGVFIGCLSLSNVIINPTSNLVQINDYVFENTIITNLYIPPKVTALGMCVDHTLVDTITCGSSNYKVVENVVFSANLEELIIFPPMKTGGYRVPNTTKTIGNDAFRSSRLTYIEIPSSVTKLETSCFARIKYFTFIHLPDSINELPETAFYQSTGIKYLFIPSSVSKLGTDVFTGSGLRCVHFPPSLSSADLLAAGLPAWAIGGECDFIGSHRRVNGIAPKLIFMSNLVAPWIISNGI